MRFVEKMGKRSKEKFNAYTVGAFQRNSAPALTADQILGIAVFLVDSVDNSATTYQQKV